MNRHVAIAGGLVGICVVLAWATLSTSASGDLRSVPFPAHPTAPTSPTSPTASRDLSMAAATNDGPTETVPYHAPLQRLSTDRDLFATYRELDRSTRGGDLHVANTILFACYLTSRAESDLRPVAAGFAKRGFAEPLPVQIEAARDLLSRCSGFDGMSRLALQQARADLRGRLDRADDPVGWSEGVLRNGRPVSDDLLRSILASQDAVAILDVAPALFEHASKAAGRPIARDDEAVLQATVEQGVLTTLVACELDGDCGSDGFEMKRACAFQLHLCGKDRRAWFLDELSTDERPRMVSRAATLVRAIRDNDATAWGL